MLSRCDEKTGCSNSKNHDDVTAMVSKYTQIYFKTDGYDSFCIIYTGCFIRGFHSKRSHYYKNWLHLIFNLFTFERLKYDLIMTFNSTWIKVKDPILLSNLPVLLGFANLIIWSYSCIAVNHGIIECFIQNSRTLVEFQFHWGR